MKKKSLLAIVLFLLFGLTIYTFANPSAKNEKADGKNNHDEQVEESETNTLQNLNDNEVPLVPLTLDNNNNNNGNDNAPLNDNNDGNKIVPVIVLNEKNTYKMEINTTIPEFKATATADGKEIDVVINNDINPAKVGKYIVKFTAEYDGNSVTIEKDFYVVDTQAPIFITKDNAIGQKVLVLAKDDSDFTVKLINKDTKINTYIENNKNIDVDGIYEVVATDISGNSSSITITIDNIKPVITLKGNEEIVVRLNKTYTDLGATALDNLDGDITDEIITTGKVNTSVKDTYTIKYNVMDKASNKADEVIRTIYVVSVKDLIDAINDGNNLIDLLDNKDLRKDLEELVEKLKDAIKDGNKIIDNKNSKQDVIDQSEKEIRDIIDQIKKLKFAIKYVDYDNSEINTYTVDLGKDAPIPENPERVGYSFTGWDKKAIFVTNDMTIKAQYDANKDTKYVVKTYFEEIDGSFSEPVVDNRKGTSDDTITISNLTNFNGFVTPTIEPVKIKADGSTVIEIKYLRVVNNVVFKVDGEEYKVFTNVKYGQTINVPEYTPVEGYNFSGWKNVPETMGTKPLEFNGTTSIKTFTVTFKVNGNDYTSRTVNYNGSVDMTTIKNPSNYKDNYKIYTFNKWDGKITNIKADTTVNAVFDSETRYYNVTFKDYDGKVLKTVTDATYGNSVIAPSNPIRTNYTFTGWSNNDYQNVTKDNIIVTAQYKANQIKIRAEVKPTMMLQFQKGGTYNIKNYINVYEVYADGREKLATNYTVNGFSTTQTKDHAPLNITQNNFSDNSLTYNVINEKAYQTKFEINYTGKSYRETKDKFFECRENCDSNQNTNSVGLNYSVIEIIEHYDEAIEIDSVKVLYKNSTNYTNIYVTDMVRWSHRSGFIFHDYYNPVYIGKLVESSDFWTGNTYTDIMDNNKTIDKVNVTYTRDGYGTYVVVFKYDKDSKTFTPIDEYKI